MRSSKPWNQNMKVNVCNYKYQYGLLWFYCETVAGKEMCVYIYMHRGIFFF